MKFKGKRLVKLFDWYVVHWWEGDKHYYRAAPKPQADGGGDEKA